MINSRATSGYMGLPSSPTGYEWSVRIIERPRHSHTCAVCTDYISGTDRLAGRGRDDCTKLRERVKSLRPEGCHEDGKKFAEAWKPKDLFLRRALAGELSYNVLRSFSDGRSEPDMIASPPKSSMPTSSIDGLPWPTRTIPEVEMGPSPVTYITMSYHHRTLPRPEPLAQHVCKPNNVDSG